MNWLKNNLANYQLVVGVIIAVFVGIAAASSTHGFASYLSRHSNTSHNPARAELLYTGSPGQPRDTYNPPPQSGQPAGSDYSSQVVFPTPKPTPSPAPAPIGIEPIDRCAYLEPSKMPCTYHCPDAVNFSSDTVCHPCGPNSITDVVCANENTL